MTDFQWRLLTFGLLFGGAALGLALVMASSASAEARGGGASWFDYCRPRMARIRNTAPAKSPYVVVSGIELSSGRSAAASAIAGAMGSRGKKTGYTQIK